jgi:alkylation response protein AidB-like acyl-CoA dehydrogenase
MMRTTAMLKDGYYTVNGSKCFCSQANLADVICLLAKTDPDAGSKGISCLLLEKGTPGYEISLIEDKIGSKGSPTNQVFIEGCRIPKENLVGKEGEGLSLAMKALDRGRILIGAMAVGLAQGAVNMAVDYGKDRMTFGKPIVYHQGIQFKIADMVMEIEAARQLVYKAAGMIDHKSPQMARFSAMAKCFATDVLMKVSIEAIQIYGGYGLCREYHIEKYMREAKTCQIVEGTNEMQRITIANEFLRGR